MVAAEVVVHNKRTEETRDITRRSSSNINHPISRIISRITTGNIIKTKALVITRLLLPITIIRINTPIKTSGSRTLSNSTTITAAAVMEALLNKRQTKVITD